MIKIILSFFLLILIAACTSFDISHHNASITEPNFAIKRVAVIDFDFARPEEGRTDRGRITTPINAGSIMADIFVELGR